MRGKQVVLIRRKRQDERGAAQSCLNRRMPHLSPAALGLGRSCLPRDTGVPPAMPLAGMGAGSAGRGWWQARESLEWPGVLRRDTWPVKSSPSRSRAVAEGGGGRIPEVLRLAGGDRHLLCLI